MNINNFKKSAITNPKFNINCKILKGSYVASRLSIPFGQTCYLLCGDVLNALKIKYIFAVAEGGTFAKGLWCAAESAKANGAVRCFHISDMGVTNNEYNQPTYLFSSVEAYKNKGNNDRYGDVYFEATPLASYVQKYVAPIGYGYATVPCEYYTIDANKNVQSHDFISQVWADKDGLHLYPEEYIEFANKGNVYTSSEAAYRAKHRSVEVVEFTTQPEPKKEQEYAISITVTAKAMTEAEAKKKLIEAITTVGISEVK